MNANLSASENAFMAHMRMFGSDGYPVQKVGRKWRWAEAFGIRGPGVCYATKRECVSAVERYIDVLRDKCAGRDTEAGFAAFLKHQESGAA